MTQRIIDSELFQAIFQMVDKDNEDSYLISRLHRVAKVKEITNNSLQITFINGWKVILLNELDVYYLITDRISIYINDDTFTSKMSSDRIFFYLNRILDLVIYGR